MTERKKKIILWSVMTILAVGLFFWWVKNAQKRLEGFQAKEFIKSLNLPQFNAEKISTTTE